MARRRRWVLAIGAVAAAWLVAPAAATEAPCPTAMPRPAMPLALARGEPVRRLGAAASAGGFRIQIAAGPGLAAAPDALAAVERAAQQWEAVLSDPITVTLDIDLQDLGESGPLGWAASFTLQVSYAGLRQRLVEDAGGGLPSLLPAPGALGVLLPAGFVASGNVVGTKAAFKAIGFADLDGLFPGPDAIVRLNARAPLDLDARDGVAADRFDLETIVAHEIGHGLGFLSAVDVLDAAEPPMEIMLHVLDLFRFQAQSAADPATAEEFQTMPRSVIPGTAAVFDDLVLEGPMSTGRVQGDGRQASHWKDDRLSGVHIGVMDPTLRAGERAAISAADLRALGAIGWNVVGADADGPTTSTTSTSTSTTVAASSSTTATLPGPTTTTLPGGAPACDTEVSAAAAARCRADLLRALVRDAAPDAFRTPAARRRLTRTLDRVLARASRLERRGPSPRRLRATHAAVARLTGQLRRLRRRALVDRELGGRLADLARELRRRLPAQRRAGAGRATAAEYASRTSSRGSPPPSAGTTHCSRTAAEPSPAGNA